MNNLQDLQLLQLKFHVTTAERRVIKLVNQTLKSAFLKLNYGKFNYTYQETIRKKCQSLN